MPNEYVWKPDGRFIRRPGEYNFPGETEIEVNAETFASFMPKSRVKIKNFVPGPNGNPIGVSAEETNMVFSIQLPLLKIITTFETKTDGKIIPTWQREGTADATLLWTPPARCTLIYSAAVLRMQPGDYPDDMRWMIKKGSTYLFALNPNRVSYKLPLPNLYNDCHICAGHGDIAAASPLQIFLQSLELFETSHWNSDLLDSISGQADKARQLFTFQSKGSKDNTFKSIPFTGEQSRLWEAYCAPGSHSILEQVTLL